MTNMCLFFVKLSNDVQEGGDLGVMRVKQLRIFFVGYKK